MPFGRRPMSLRDAIQVTRGNQSVENPSVSADGKMLYYDSDLSGTSQLYRVPAAGGEQERLTTDNHQDFAPRPRPTGTPSPSIPPATARATSICCRSTTAR